MDLDQPATEEFIQHYTQKNSCLKKALKFKETFSEVKPKLLCKALRFTSYLPGELYTPAECMQQVEYFTQKAVAEECIENYADKYKKLIRKHKFAMPLCKHTNKNILYNTIETTSNIPAGYYITAECIKDVEKFVQKMYEKFGHKDGPFYKSKVVIEIFLHDLEHF